MSTRELAPSIPPLVREYIHAYVKETLRPEYEATFKQWQEERRELIANFRTKVAEVNQLRAEVNAVRKVLQLTPGTQRNLERAIQLLMQEQEKARQR